MGPAPPTSLQQMGWSPQNMIPLPPGTGAKEYPAVTCNPKARSNLGWNNTQCWLNNWINVLHIGHNWEVRVSLLPKHSPLIRKKKRGMLSGEPPEQLPEVQVYNKTLRHSWNSWEYSPSQLRFPHTASASSVTGEVCIGPTSVRW